MIRTVLFLGIILFSYSKTIAQDTIVKRNNERVVCKIKEISTDEIKYQMLNNEVIFGIDKNEVSKVILFSGVTMNFQHSMEDKDNYKNQKKNCLKFRLLSPLYGYSDLIYERSLKPGSSIEGSLGIIGLGKQYNEDIKGVSLEIGYKFIKSPDFYIKGMKYTHLLKGSYFKPEVAVSSYKRNSNDIFSMALLFNIGNQWIFNDLVAVDLFFGLGYGYSSDNSFNLQYGYSTGDKDFPVAISAGFRIGFLLK
ncbi:MAG: hypothetical protein HXX16_05680 [Bacteroidales bacterium]|nr:hypothetical protein [Bacteroidales bacterium]